MLEFLTSYRDLLDFGPAALGQDVMAGVAIIGLDGSLAVFGRMPAVVAAKTARPVPMANVVRIDAPVGFHPGEKVIQVNSLNCGNRLPKTCTVSVMVAKKRGNAALGLGVGFVGSV